jgi:hypothetical protein
MENASASWRASLIMANRSSEEEDFMRKTLGWEMREK